MISDGRINLTLAVSYLTCFLAQKKPAVMEVFSSKLHLYWSLLFLAILNFPG